MRNDDWSSSICSDARIDAVSTALILLSPMAVRAEPRPDPSTIITGQAENDLMTGTDRYYTSFVPGVPSANTKGMERLGGGKSVAEMKAMLRTAGYAGERLVALHATDDSPGHAEMQVVIARLRAVGMTVDDVTTDTATTLQRMRSKEPLDKGGWSMIVFNPDGSAHLDPLVALGLRTGAAAFVGWPENQRLEDLRTAWIDSTDDAERHRLAEEIQDEGLKEVVIIPLGRFFRPSAWRRNVSGILPAVVPLFWNVRKT